MLLTRYTWFERHDIVQVGPRPYIMKMSENSLDWHSIIGVHASGDLRVEICAPYLGALTRTLEKCIAHTHRIVQIAHDHSNVQAG